jgi:glutamine amidotransferase-like uncharacterized protein
VIKPKIALFLHHPEASRQCCEGMIKALSPHYNVTVFSIEECNSKTLARADLIAFPGGIGDADSYYQFFKRRTANLLADYVDDGGRYLGICMGAYWAAHHYFDILDGIDAVQYIKRPDSGVRRSYSTVVPVTWNGQLEDMFFYDGCALVGDTSKADIVSTYANGDVMALIQDRIGLIGCHPESTESWYNKSYLTPYWHRNQHHHLLLEFVDSLMQR